MKIRVHKKKKYVHPTRGCVAITCGIYKENARKLTLLPENIKQSSFYIYINIKQFLFLREKTYRLKNEIKF